MLTIQINEYLQESRRDYNLSFCSQIQRFLRRCICSKAAKVIQRQLKGLLVYRKYGAMLSEQRKEAYAEQHYRASLMTKLIRMLKSNANEAKAKRQTSRAYQLLQSANMEPLKAHREIMQRRDFWAIFPEDGKFVMAAKFHSHRVLATCLTRWMISSQNLQS